jgi:hypothetical protein
MYATINFNSSIDVANCAAELPDTTEGTGAVRSGGEVCEPRGSFGDCGQHRITMRNGFVAWKSERSQDVLCWTDDHRVFPAAFLFKSCLRSMFFFLGGTPNKDNFDT